MKKTNKKIATALGATALGAGIITAAVAQSCNQVTSSQNDLSTRTNNVVTNVFNLTAPLDPTNSEVPNDVNTNVSMMSIEQSRNGGTSTDSFFTPVSVYASGVIFNSAQEVTESSTSRYYRQNFTVVSVSQNNSQTSRITNVGLRFDLDAQNNFTNFGLINPNNTTTGIYSPTSLETQETQQTNVGDYLGFVLNDTNLQSSLFTVLNQNVFNDSQTSNVAVTPLATPYVFDLTYEFSDLLLTTTNNEAITDYYLWTFRTSLAATTNNSTITHVSLFVGINRDFSSLELPLLAST